MFTQFSLFVMIISFPILLIAQEEKQSSIADDGQPYHALNSIKGTLDDAGKTEPNQKKQMRQYVYPDAMTNEYSNNPWLNSKPTMKESPKTTGLPKGNPWAPIGAEPSFKLNSPRSAGVFESNPYTDSTAQGQLSQSVGNSFSQSPYWSPYQIQSFPFGNMMNQPFNHGNFSMPFNNDYFPSNNFWPRTNNGNGSFPFMPW